MFSQVKFSANFDSGSIGSHELIDSAWIHRANGDSILALSYIIRSKFDPLNPIDTSLTPNARWYFFSMTGVKKKQLFLNIQNSEAIRPFYSYDGLDYKRLEHLENIFEGSINKIFTKDTVFIAHFIPYTYSRLLTKLEEWRAKSFVANEIIGESSLGLPIEMLTVTDKSVNDNLKKKVWIHGRSHPSESPASWHLEAMIDQIVSDTPLAKELRKNTIFYLVPIINPDGVKGGFSRSSSTGVNIEINWDQPDSLTMPEVKTLKKAIEKITLGKPLDLFLNMHSQISNSITYWIHTAESTSEMFLRKQLLLSALTINYSPYYRAEDQSFSDLAARYAEGWIWKKFGQKTIALTFETPYTYYNQEIEGPWVSLENLSELALSSLYSISDLLGLNKTDRIILDPFENKTAKNWEQNSENSKLFFGESYLVAQKKEAKLKYSLTNLQKGRYTLYRWQIGPASTDFSSDSNIWIKEAIVIQKRDGKFNFKIKAKEKGESADALLLVREFY